MVERRARANFDRRPTHAEAGYQNHHICPATRASSLPENRQPGLLNTFPSQAQLAVLPLGNCTSPEKPCLLHCGHSPLPDDMDSMRALNKSLPSTTSSKRKTAPQPDLHQAFRSAALSVTNLYKTAAADQARAHAEGYQEALEELIGFLDKEGLGLCDGEGWRVRQWATERFEGAVPGQATSDSDDEAQEEKRARSSSPIMQRKPSPEVVQSSLPPQPASPPRPESAPPMPVDLPTPSNHIDTTPLRTDFTFRSSHAFPSSQESEMDMSDHSGSNSNITTIPSMRVEVVPRRSSNRQFSRTNSRPSSNLGSGAGFKRRLPFGDYFDISGSWNERKDGFGGSKRNRFS